MLCILLCTAISLANQQVYAEAACDQRSGLIQFYVQHARTIGSTYYTVNNVSTITSSYLQGTRIHFVTHGWTQNITSMEDLGYEIYKNNEGPAIMIDWSVWSGSTDPLTYIPACKQTRDVGGEVAQFIIELEKLGFSRSNMHLIGFSLGGKVMAQAGECLNGQVARLSGLDTPLYCIDELLTEPWLDPSDAQFVDTIRTTAISGSYDQEQGHADFFVGCNNWCTCVDLLEVWTIDPRHGKAVKIFKNSIRNTTCQIAVNQACFCPIPMCTSSSNTMGYPATKPSQNRKYMVDMVGFQACEQ